MYHTISNWKKKEYNVYKVLTNTNLYYKLTHPWKQNERFEVTKKKYYSWTSFSIILEHYTLLQTESVQAGKNTT